MKDWVFYPLVGLIAVVIIAIALSFGRSEEIDTSAGLVLEGSDLSRLIVAPGNTSDMSNSGSPVFATLRSHSLRKDAPSAGVFLALPPQYQKDYDQKDLTFTLRARQAKRKGVSSFRAGFFAPGGSTDWKEYAVGTDFQDFTFTFKPNRVKKGNDFFYFGVWADWSGQGGGVDVERMSVIPANVEKAKVD